MSYWMDMLRPKPTATGVDYWNQILTTRRHDLLGSSQNAGMEADGRKYGRWDDDLASLQTALAMAQSLRNDYISPAGQLPPEILANIFELLLEDDFNYNYPGYEERFPLYVPIVSHVCRRWRNIAFKHKRIGSYVYLNDPMRFIIGSFQPRFQQIDQRPLRVFGRFTSDHPVLRSFSDAVFKLRERIPYIRALSIHGNRSTYKDLDAFLGEDAQQLRSLRLCFPSQLSRSSSDPVDYLRILDFSNICKHLCKASHIRLEGMWFPWAKTFTNLRSLMLYTQFDRNFEMDYSSDDDIPINSASMYTDILVGLRNMQNLRVLVLFEVLPLDLQLEETKVQLPHLQSLHLAGRAEPALEFWNRLHLPRDVSVTLDLFTTNNEGQDRLFDVLRQNLAHPDSSFYPHLSISLSTSFIYHLTAHVHNDHSAIPFPDSSYHVPGFHIRLPFFIGKPASLCRSYAFACISPVQCLESLSLFGPFFWTQDEMESVLAKANLLRHLEFSVSPTSIRNLFRVLVKDQVTLRTSDNIDVTSNADVQVLARILPSLVSLRFELVDFDLHGIDRTLLTALLLRHVSGIGIGRLELASCTINYRTITQLSKFTPNLRQCHSRTDVDLGYYPGAIGECCEPDDDDECA